jgi:NACalpha-BTF3-like transcription factor
MVEDAMALLKDEGMKEEPEKKGIRKVKGRKEKQSTANPLDIRTVVEQGKKDNKSAYKSLKEAEYIISFEDDIFSMELVW